MMFLMVCHREPSNMHHTPFPSPPRFTLIDGMVATEVVEDLSEDWVTFP